MELAMAEIYKPNENETKCHNISSCEVKAKLAELDKQNREINQIFNAQKDYTGTNNERGICEFDINEEIADSDPVDVWNSIRPWASSNISCWDFLCDKARSAEYPYYSNEKDQYILNSQAYKIQVK